MGGGQNLTTKNLTHLTTLKQSLVQVVIVEERDECENKEMLAHFSEITNSGKRPPLLFFLHRPKTAQGIKLKLSDFKDTLLRHILQVKPVRQISSCCHGNKITEGTSQDLAPKKSEKSAICRAIALKFGIWANFGPLSSKPIIKFQSDVNLTSS